jgi:hypothetical protein
LRLKQHHWRNFLALTTSTSVFQAFQFTKPRSGGGILPLKGANGSLTSNKEEQAKLLFEGTSVVTSKCDLCDVPPAKDSFFVVYPSILHQEALTVLSRLAKNKASGPNRIPNQLLTIVVTELADILTTLFNRCLVEGVFPKAWQTATTAIIRKFNKPDYTTLGA